ncbi:hypothetical protein GIX45_25085 [Erwinia sp. CPCC 100877]|nr:hypothetical protein [Erwinia sp. CPCC 100877]
MKKNEKEQHLVSELKQEKMEVEAELRALSSEEDQTGGFPWTVPVGLSIAFCPTGKCTSACR